MSEAQEIADNMFANAPKFASFMEAERYVAAQLGDGYTTADQIVDNIAEALYKRQSYWQR